MQAHIKKHANRHNSVRPCVFNFLENSRLRFTVRPTAANFPCRNNDGALNPGLTWLAKQWPKQLSTARLLAKTRAPHRTLTRLATWLQTEAPFKWSHSFAQNTLQNPQHSFVLTDCLFNSSEQKNSIVVARRTTVTNHRTRCQRAPLSLGKNETACCC